MPVACLGDQVGTQTTLARAIAYAANPATEPGAPATGGADIIVSSLGPNGADWALTSTLDLALQSDVHAASETIKAWATDFRADCARIDVPLLVIHGDGDQNVPMGASSQRMPGIVDGAHLHVIDEGPHGLNVSHQKEWEQAILDFVDAL